MNVLIVSVTSCFRGFNTQTFWMVKNMLIGWTFHLLIHLAGA